MYGICLDCGEIYDLEKIIINNNHDRFCPKTSCNGIIVHIKVPKDLGYELTRRFKTEKIETDYCIPLNTIILKW